jgi:hypothetical protein
MRIFNESAIAIAPLVALTVPAPASAADVTLRGSLLSSCLLTLSTEGKLVASSDPTVIGSEESGGNAALLAVVAVGATPTVNFSAPTIDGPAGLDSGAQAQIRYTSLGGSNQSYTSSASSSSQVRLLDTFTINARIVSPNGFAAGNYVVRTTTTCQQ